MLIHDRRTHIQHLVNDGAHGGLLHCSEHLFADGLERILNNVDSEPVGSRHSDLLLALDRHLDMVIPVTVPVYLVARKDNERCSRFLDDSWARDSLSGREIIVAEYLGGLDPVLVEID